MTTTPDNNKRIAKNALFLYVRMFFLMFVQLYTVPIILKTLGTEDYGIYNVVAGVVTLFSFIGGSLASGSQRFISFELGRNNKKNLKSVFDTTISIYLIIGLIIFILLETFGVGFLNSEMSIPVERLYAANWVLQLAIITFLFNLMTIPFSAAIIAHEHMNLYAYISIVECLCKLGIALSLPIITTDHLITYSLMVCFVQLIILIGYIVYCRKHFDECKKLQLKLEPTLKKELLNYSGWNMIGSIAMIMRMQGINIIINLFFGPLLNAAHAIAQQINGVLSQFINNVYMATRPQITKLYANNEIKEMWKLVFISSKFTYYLLMILSIPLLIEMNTLLNLWLHKVPTFTVAISRLMILTILIETLANQIIAAYQAANNIKKYQITSSTILLCNLPFSYLILLIFPKQVLLPYIVSVILSIIFTFSVLINASVQINFDFKEYSKKVLSKVIPVYLITLCFVLLLIQNITPSLARVLYTILLTICTSIFTIGIIGMNAHERKYAYTVIKKRLIR